MSEEKREVNLDEVVAEIDFKNPENTKAVEQEKEVDESEAKPTEKSTEETEEEKSDDESEKSTEETEDDTSADGLKEVEGETPKERAMRATITRLRQEKREKTFSSNETEEEIKDDSAYQALLDEGYTKEDIENSKKILKVLAPQLGLVNQKQTWSEKANSTLEDFIEENPEYSPKNDTDDTRWSYFQEILKNDYNIKGKNPSQLKVIFSKVNRDVINELGEATVINKKAKIAAQKEKIKSVSSNSSTSNIKTEEKPAEVKKIGNNEYNIGGIKFKGFDDEDFN